MNPNDDAERHERRSGERDYWDSPEERREYEREMDERNDIGPNEDDGEDVFDAFAEPWNPLELTLRERNPVRVK